MRNERKMMRGAGTKNLMYQTSGNISKGVTQYWETDIDATINT